MYSDELIQMTRATFEPEYGRKLTQGEVEEIISNMVEYFNLLAEIDRSTNHIDRKDGYAKEETKS